MDRRRNSARHQLQQPATSPLPFSGEGRNPGGAAKPAIVLLRGSSPILREVLVPPALRGYAGGLWMGSISIAFAADPLPVCPGVGRARAAGAGNPRHPGPG